MTNVSATGVNATYAYNADGKRVKQTLGSTVTNYLWDEASAYGDVVYEYNNSGTALASYVLGGTGLISQTRSGTTNYYLQDGQGSTRALTNSSGAVTDTYSYTAFGELFSSTGTTTNPYRYTGQQFDSSTGLYDLRARYYNPALGRFLSQDTYPVNFNSPVELNRYIYTGNDPINGFDPTGHYDETEYSGITGTMVGVLSHGTTLSATAAFASGVFLLMSVTYILYVQNVAVPGLRGFPLPRGGGVELGDVVKRVRGMITSINYVSFMVLIASLVGNIVDVRVRQKSKNLSLFTRRGKDQKQFSFTGT